ncbi:MAG: DUF262 domain-containing HNH endonuclease family protein [Candidatus Dadabacteria bacterium]|nr:DUF262 domain-containing HNH endonuclease family protein [Candidatus Dadabacteria bacterium]
MSRSFKRVYLEPENKTFGDIMSNAKSYRIPAFQRDYAWQHEQLDELWQDIENMRESETQHFLGYLVLQSGDGKNFEVIDGQQRLTTVTLMIIAVLGRFQQIVDQGESVEENKKRVDFYHKTYLGVFDAMSLETSLKLTLNRNNNGHFRDIITEPYGVPRRRGVTASNRHLNKALEFFQDKVSSYNSQQLVQFVNDIADGLLFTAITVKDDLDAYLVFETLNARGVHLSAPDLLKNYLLSVMSKSAFPSHDVLEQFNEIWAEVLEQLGETNFTGFLRSYHGMSDKLSHKKDLYRVMKRKIEKTEDVMPYVRGMKRFASIYSALQNPDDSFWREYENGVYQPCCDHLATLKLFGIKTQLSLLMAAYAKLNPTDFIQMTKWIAVVSIRYNVICGKVAKDQEIAYNKLANGIMSGGYGTANDVRGGLMVVYPSDAEFVSAFSLKSMPSRQSARKVVFLLRQIERHVSGGGMPVDNLSLEHVLPYSPDNFWEEYFGRENCSEATDRLGNMAILPQGQNMGQEPFEEKKMNLASSGYRINQEIAKHDEWNMDSLNSHQNWLAQQAKTVWRIS